ncbi:MAG: acyl carrier protein [Legionellales bacterium]
MADIEHRVKTIVSEQLEMRVDQIYNEASFMQDLGADSLDLVELVLSFETDFHITIPDHDTSSIVTVQSAIDYVREKRMRA